MERFDFNPDPAAKIQMMDLQPTPEEMPDLAPETDEADLPALSQWVAATLSAILLVVYAPSQAHADLGGSDAAAYLQYAYGARPAAVGGAAIALPSDVSPFGGEPASLATLEPDQLSLSHATLLGGGSAQVLSFGMPAGPRTVWSLGLASFHLGGIEVRSASDVPVGEFADSRLFAAGSVGTRLTDRLFLGFALKAAREALAPGATRSLWAQDVGALWIPLPSLILAAAVRNLSIFDGSARPDTEVATGASYVLPWLRTALVSELRWTERGNVHLASGLETRPIDWFAVRVGANETNWTVGLGVHFGPYQLDYAALMGGPETFHRLTATVEFGGYGIRLRPSVSTFSPAGEVKNVTYLVITHTRAEILSWEFTIKSSEGRVLRTYTGENSPPDNVTWDGRDDHGAMAMDGTYSAELSVHLVGGESASSAPVRVQVASLGSGAPVDVHVE